MSYWLLKVYKQKVVALFKLICIDVSKLLLSFLHNFKFTVTINWIALFLTFRWCTTCRLISKCIITWKWKETGHRSRSISWFWHFFCTIQGLAHSSVLVLFLVLILQAFGWSCLCHAYEVLVLILQYYIYTFDLAHLALAWVLQAFTKS